MTNWFILDDNNNAIPASMAESAELMSNIDRRRVGYYQEDGYTVSTVFLCMDHRHHGDIPVLFEMMVTFPDAEHEHMERFTTWNRAKRAHLACVARIHFLLEAQKTGSSSYRKTIPNWED